MHESLIPSLGQKDPLEDKMAAHSNILAWKISMDKGAWRATVHGCRVEQDLATKQQISMYQ